jgi:hypothetical protein
MKKNIYLNHLFVSILLVASLALNILRADPVLAEATGNLLYVDASATGANNGTSWANAYTDLQDALRAIVSGKIWVAEGIYYPGESGERDAAFHLKSNVSIYGGFPLGGGVFEDRDPTIFVTVLSGDIDRNDPVDADGVVTDTDGISGNNSYHVVQIIETDESAVLDGFVITAGNADFPTIHTFDTFGGGMSVMNASPSLANLVFSGNKAEPEYHGGGGMFNWYSDPRLTHIIFYHNSAGGGGGMYNHGSNPVLTDVVFIENTAISGAGMNNYEGSNPTLDQVIFQGNTAALNAGGMANDLTSNPVLDHVSFIENSTRDYGGGIGNFGGSPRLTDVEFIGNSAKEGGGMYNGLSGKPDMTNVTFFENTARTLGGGMANNDSSPVLVNVTFSANRAGEYGGGMCNFYTSSRPLLTNVTFTGNKAPHGSAICNVGGGFKLVNGIVWGNTGAPEQIYNDHIVPDIAYSDIEGGWTGVGNINEDPHFDFFGYYESATQLYSLLVESPAIDNGSPTGCPATDQTGSARPVDGNGDGRALCDMGAFEYLPPGYTTATSREEPPRGDLARIELINKTNQAATLFLQSEGATYVLNVEARTAKTFTVEREIYRRETHACGSTDDGFLNVHRHLRLIFTRCKGLPPNQGEPSMEKIHIPDSPKGKQGDYK